MSKPKSKPPNKAQEEKTREERDRLIRMLRTAMRLLGFTNREIERRLGYTPSYLTRLLSGQIELRFEHIVEIASAMGMTVAEFFQFAYPLAEEPLSEAAQQLEDVLEELRPFAPSRRLPGNWTSERFQQIIRQGMEQIAAEMRAQQEPPKPRKKKAPAGEAPRVPAATGSRRSQSA